MYESTDTKQDNPFGIILTAPWRVCRVRALKGYRLHVQFIDGLEGIVDLSLLVCSEEAGVFKKLRDQKIFSQVHLSYGAVTWPGELDLAPDAMYETIRKYGEWVLQ